MASTTTSYPPNPPQHDPAFQPINNFHAEPHREFPPRARVDSWHESAPGLRNLTNGPAPSESNLPPPIHARPPSHPTSRRPSLAIETAASTDIEKQPQSAQPYPGSEKQPSPHAPPPTTGPPPMQHRPTTVPPMVTAKREQNIQHLPPQTAPASPSAPLQYSHHHHPPALQPSQHPHGLPPTSHPQGAFAPLQPFPTAGPPQGPPPPQMIAPGPPAVQPQTYHHHSAPPHMTPYPAPNARRLSAAPGIPEADEMSPMTGTFPYHMTTGTSFPPRRKAVRAAQACDACRTRKAKCDEGRPACTFCKDNNTPCVYREVPPPKQDRTMIMIQERVSNIESLVIKQQSDPTVVNLLKQILEAVSSKAEEDAQGRDISGASSPEGVVPQDPLLQPPSDLVIPQTAAYPMTIPPPSQVQTPTQAPANFAVPTTTGIPAPANDPKEEDNFITIPHKHNTAAHKLLRWKTIRDLLDKRYPDNYVMDEEIRRGSLKIRGRGEGDPTLDMDIQDDGPDEGPNGEYYSGMNGVHPLKGAGGRLGRGQRETLRLDMETCTSLLRSFLDNIYILHPFLNDEPLSQMVEMFSRAHGGVVEPLPEDPSLVPLHTISPENSFASMASSAMLDRSQYPGINQFQHPSYVGPPQPQAAKAGSKRKRDSTAQPGPPPFAQSDHRTFYRQTAPHNYSPQRIPATLQSAIVLLVLALGAIANHKTPVPGPLPPLPPQANMNYGLPEQFQHPPPNQPPHQAYQSLDAGLQNIDVIPGLAYCEKALQILAMHQGRSEVEYVQASLLAGLYWGQLGRPMDSWKWISAACMACQIMINQRLPREEQDEMLRDTMVRTFWSCVQLESDLLAELDVPRSGITRLEGSENLRMTYGNKVDNNLQMWLYFMAQYHIRKILNQVHSELYKVSSASSLKTASILMEDLEAWRRTLPDPLQWKDTDPPAEDINAARLRAKYYGAKYVINRPFVEHFIHNRTANTNPALMAPGAMTSPAMSLSSLSQSSPPTSAHTPIGLDNRRGSMVTDEIREKFLDPCRTCLEAAVKSTSAFHGFDANSNRPILTNIFGTAHAQFGNLLVLQAAYKHPKLREFVDRATLGDLLDKTIRFLHTLAPISPSLDLDARILEDASSKLDFAHV